MIAFLGEFLHSQMFERYCAEVIHSHTNKLQKAASNGNNYNNNASAVAAVEKPKEKISAAAQAVIDASTAASTFNHHHPLVLRLTNPHNASTLDFNPAFPGADSVK